MVDLPRPPGLSPLVRFFFPSLRCLSDEPQALLGSLCPAHNRIWAVLNFTLLGPEVQPKFITLSQETLQIKIWTLTNLGVPGSRRKLPDGV